MILLNRRDMERLLPMKDAISVIEKAFRCFTQGNCVVPQRTVISTGAGDLIFMPAYSPSEGYGVLKQVSIFPDNIGRGLPSAYAQTMLIDGTTGVVSAIMDGTYLTQLRTGATTGAAVAALARKDAKVGAIIGTGGQAAGQLSGILAARSLEVVYMYDADLSRAKNFAADSAARHSGCGAKFIAVPSSAEAISDADILVTVTSSRKPVFDAAQVKLGATLCCVGSYQPEMQEMDPAIFKRASKLICDSRAAVLAEAGDLLIPIRSGEITADRIDGELGEVLLGKISGRESNEEIIIFKTVGIATQDLFTAKEFFDRAKADSCGTNWDSLD